MQSDQQLARIPVIMVSAVEEKEAVERCLKIGAVDYITKPVGAETLSDRVRRALHLP
jgi:DNA-binding response OmpR family regulator